MHQGNARNGWSNLAMIGTGHSFEDILIAYPYLELDDIKQSLQYAAWRVQEIEVPVNMAA